MPQVFHRSFNTISKVSIFGAVFLLVFGLWAYGRFVRSSYATGQDVFVDQPIVFSHQHHVGGLGIDCRYCHTSVETSAFAGIPSTRVCMNCHYDIWLNSPLLEPARDSYRRDRPIPWVRVHNLGDFAYFDHSVHIKKGVGCSECHGEVHKMPLMRQAASLRMEWCLQCHRDPGPRLRSREKIFDTTITAAQWQAQNGKTPKDMMEIYRIHNTKRLTDCSICHR